MTQQGLRQAGARAISGFVPSTNYNEDFQRMFDVAGIPAGTFNERQLRWINYSLGTNYTDLTEAMQAFATAQGAYNWSSLGTVGAVPSVPAGQWLFNDNFQSSHLLTSGVL